MTITKESNLQRTKPPKTITIKRKVTPSINKRSTKKDLQKEIKKLKSEINRLKSHNTELEEELSQLRKAQDSDSIDFDEQFRDT